jgi:hypothetical protein
MRPKVPTSPPRESLVLDQGLQASSETTEVSTSEFGAIGQDISSVTNLPDELRVGTATAADAVAVGGGKLILVVDDEEDIRKLLKRLLTQKGHRVIEADRGLLALRLVTPCSRSSTASTSRGASRGAPSTGASPSSW